MPKKPYLEMLVELRLLAQVRAPVARPLPRSAAGPPRQVNSSLAVESGLSRLAAFETLGVLGAGRLGINR